MDDARSGLLQSLPAVGEFLDSVEGRRLVATFGEGMVKCELRHALALSRLGMREGRIQKPLVLEDLATRVADRLRHVMEPLARRAINATGILLHTGLGRAPLCEAAREAIQSASGYTPVQADPESGERSLREACVEQLLQELTGCEAATVVNNNAAATMLVLNDLAAGKEVVISRGQLVEIGGSFRMTDVMVQSGAVLREVGTTNRTSLGDYQTAIGARTGALIRVHTSNYRIRGFASTPTISELVALGKTHGLPVVDDLGSGALVPLREWGVGDEPLVRESLSAGADVVCFSGDKLVCGPQAGILCGRKSVIERIRMNPYSRMFRVCKLTLAALEATLAEFVNGTYRRNIPFYRMLDRSVADLDREGQALAASLGGIPGLSAGVGEDLAYVGSGSIPDEGLATRVVRLRHSTISSGEIARRLRTGIPAVYARLADREVVLDLRTLRDGELAQVETAVRRILDAS